MMVIYGVVSIFRDVVEVSRIYESWPTIRDIFVG